MQMKEPETTIKYTTVGEIARELRVTPQCIYQFVKDGKLPVVRIGSAMRVPVEEYHRWLEEHTTPAKK
jgi:excisionase family DNA binding protein